MRAVDIHLRESRLFPGEKLEGMVSIRTDRPFECNRVILKVRGKEHTEHGSGDTRVTDDKVIIGKVFRINEGRMFPEGATMIPFAIPLPKNLPPSYQGYYGHIEYSAEAVVEVTWAIDPKCKKLFKVLQNRPPFLEDKNQLEPSTIKQDELQVQLEENIFRLETGLRVRFKVEQRNNVRGVRFEIVKREVANCGRRTLERERPLERKFHEVHWDDFDRWLEIEIGNNWRYHLPFVSNLFKVTYHLKVTLDVGWNFDPSIKCPLKFSDSAPKRDLLDEIAIDLGFDEW
ncbi:hypothetical protein EU527_13340 [Candidatus Thorarchaeota archaeon]|nr:MAG: hypothetical protein EU527_13340 [Candidatus Thorarchaeota archaeon]